MIDTNTLDAFLRDTFNEEQAQAVQTMQNCVVKAGAGSGKTRVLTYRFFYLVATGKASVDEILTLTFTKAAAAEMFERIQRIFSDFSHDPDILTMMQNFQEAAISTLDSFCYQVVQMDLSRFGLTAEFTLDPAEADAIATRAVLRKLSGESDSPAVRYISELYSPERIAEALILPLFSRFFWFSMPFDPCGDTVAVREEIQRIINVRLEEFRRVADALWGYAGDLEGYKVVQKNSATLEQVFALLDSNPGGQVIPNLSKVRGKHELIEEYNDLIVRYQDLRDSSLREITYLNSADDDLLEEIYGLLDELHREVTAIKRERQILSYYDVAQMARSILTENEQVRSSLSETYRYIMVDEFQDTNEMQKEILYLLSLNDPKELRLPIDPRSLHPGKLFLVGDEKQSIYRFRGADVSVFRRLDREIGRSGGYVLPLRRNYRSENSLISTFNSLFREIFQEPQEQWDAEFQALEARDEQDRFEVHRNLFVIEQDSPEEGIEGGESADEEQESLETVETEALFLADLIENIVESGTYLIEREGELVRPSYDDIAILMRTYSPQLQYEKYLRMKGIPYVLSEVRSLHLEAVTNDIACMLQLLVFPEDLFAYAAVLRSPLCYIADDQLIGAMDAARERGIFSERTWPGMDEISGKKYDAARNLYHRLGELSQSGTLTSLVSLIWNEGGYRHNLLSDPSYSVFIEHIEYLMELAAEEDREGGSLVAFTDRLRSIIAGEEDTKNLSILTEQTRGVHLMSIHKSKGLQFPVVIVAACGKGSQPDRTPGVYLWDRGDRTVAVPYHGELEGKGINLIYDAQKESLRLQNEAELKRLLYVACTRAESHLLFSGVVARGNTDEKHRNHNFLSMLLASSPSLHGIEVTTLPSSQFTPRRHSIRQEDIQEKVRQTAPRYEIPWKNPVFTPRITGVTRGGHESVEDPSVHHRRLAALPSDEIIAAHGIQGPFGTWVHALFESMLTSVQDLMDPDFDRLTDDHALTLRPSILAQSGLTGTEESLLVSDIIRIVRNVLLSPLFVRLREPAPKAVESELEFMARLHLEGMEQAVSGIIDLFLQYEDHIIILDFKTDSHLAPEVHERQLSIYRKAMQKMFSCEIRSVLCYVREPDRDVWLSD